MKQYFFLAILALIAFAGIGWFLWMVVRALHTVYSDWRLARELDELEAECAERRRDRANHSRVGVAAPTAEATFSQEPLPKPAQTNANLSDFDITV